MIVDEIHEISSNKQNKWIEKYIMFNTQMFRAKNDFEKEFYNLLNNAFYEKKWRVYEIV